MTWSLLYLDSCKDKAISKALSKYGKVRYVESIDDALFKIADDDYDYFFIDSDVPQAQAFIKHIRHDPQLLPPKAIVLLTDNDDEDCEAWSVDTFLNKRSISDDVPYVFSHFDSSPCDGASIIRIAPDPAKGVNQRTAGPAGRLKELAKNRGDTSPAGPDIDDSLDHIDIAERVRQRKDDRDQRNDPVRRRELEHTGRGVTDEEKLRDWARPIAGGENQRVSSRGLRIAAVALCVLALGLWLFFLGPLSSSRNNSKKSSRKLEAENSRKGNASRKVVNKSDQSSPGFGFSGGSMPAPLNSANTSAEAAGVPVVQTQPEAAPTAKTNQTPTPPPAPEPSPGLSPAPAPAPSHPAPTISVSGPATARAGETVSFSVSGTKDGVPFSYSTSRCWQAPCNPSVSVSVTDSEGRSASDSTSVSVI